MRLAIDKQQNGRLRMIGRRGCGYFRSDLGKKGLLSPLRKKQMKGTKVLTPAQGVSYMHAIYMASLGSTPPPFRARFNYA